MGTARHFNGVADSLQTPNSNDTYSAFTTAYWVKRDTVISANNGLMGRMFSAGSGWRNFIDSSNFWQTFGPVGIACPDIVTAWAYLASTYDSAGGSNNVKYYYGLTAAGITQIGQETNTGSVTELGASQPILIGNVQGGAAISVVAWNGYMDQPRLWKAALTLAQLKLDALCGSRVREIDSKIIADITGANPEPMIYETGANTLIVNGTTVLTGSMVGCDNAVPPAIHFRKTLSPIGTGVGNRKQVGVY